jgi:CRP/FNR family transcriptional regulator, cyclic AMP receptor protein
MTIDELIHHPHPFFEGMSREQLQLLGEHAAKVQFAKGEVILREADAADRFYLIQSGEVALQTHSAGQPAPVQIIRRGDVLGWSWLIPPHYSRFDALAKKNTRAIAVQGANLRARCETDPAFGYELMKRVAKIAVQRLQATRLKFVQAKKGQHQTTVAPASAAHPLGVGREGDRRPDFVARLAATREIPSAETEGFPLVH